MGGGGSKVDSHNKQFHEATTGESYNKKNQKEPSDDKSKKTSSSIHKESDVMKAAKNIVSTYTEDEIVRRTAIHMLFHLYDVDESRELNSNEFINLMIELIRDSSTTTKNERLNIEKSASTLLSYLDRDGDQILEEREFVDFIIDSMSKSIEEQNTFSKSGAPPKLLIEFLNHFSKRVILAEQALDIMFPNGKMNQCQFVSLLVQGSHAEEYDDENDGNDVDDTNNKSLEERKKKKKRGAALAWGQDKQLWFRAKTILNGHLTITVKASTHLYKNGVLSFLLCGFLMNCYEYQLNRKNKNINKNYIVKTPFNKEGKVNIKLRNLFENCIIVRLIPIMEKAELEADADYVRRLAMENWFHEISTGDVLTTTYLKRLLVNVFLIHFNGHQPKDDEITHCIHLIDNDNDGKRGNNSKKKGRDCHYYTKTCYYYYYYYCYYYLCFLPHHLKLNY
jgi:hypothetical protein